MPTCLYVYWLFAEPPCKHSYRLERTNTSFNWRKWEKVRDEASLYIVDQTKHEVAGFSTMYNGSPEPKSYQEAQSSLNLPNWLELCEVQEARQC
jgi:hypothetical protein